MDADHEPADGDPAPQISRWAKLRPRAIVAQAAQLPRAVWARLPNRRLRVIAAGGAVLALALCSSVAWFVIALQVVSTDAPGLSAALAELDRGAFAQARRMALELRKSGAVPPNELGLLYYILGAAAAQEADNLGGQEQHKFRVLAARYLQEARKQGFPGARQGDALFLLGRNLYLAGEVVESRTVLKEAFEADPKRATAINALLAEAFATEPKKDLRQALQHNQAYLSDDSLPKQDRVASLLARSRMLLEARLTDECRKSLEQIPAEGKSRADLLVIQGRLLMSAAQAAAEKAAADANESLLQQAKAKYLEAISTFQQVQGREAASQRAAREATYLSGLCNLAIDDPRAALEQFSRVRKTNPESPEGLASGIEEATLLQQQDRDEDALQIFERTVMFASEPSQYRNSWLSLEQFRSRLVAAHQYWTSEHKYAEAVKLVEESEPILPRETRLALAGQAYQQWARHLIAQTSRAGQAQVEELQRQSRAHWRNAGVEFAELSRLRSPARRYAEDLWESADGFLKGHDYVNAVDMLKQYLQAESRKRRALALMGLGEAQLTLGRADKALESLQDCIVSYPNDVASYQARLLAGKAYVALAKPEQAEKLLRENIDSDNLTPASTEWRDSLFALGQLLYEQGRYEETIRRLEEAVSRYPEAPESLDSRYLIAESYRHAAEVPREKLKSDTIEIARIAHAKQMQQLLSAAITQYEQVEDALNRRQARGELTRLEKSTLRNCYFARGSSYFDLGRYEDAIKAYSAITNRYQHQPEVLDAYMRIADCYRRMNRPSEARGTLEQAKLVLNRIKADATFTKTTNNSREDWAKMLEWLSGI